MYSQIRTRAVEARQENDLGHKAGDFRVAARDVVRPSSSGDQAILEPEAVRHEGQPIRDRGCQFASAGFPRVSNGLRSLLGTPEPTSAVRMEINGGVC